MPLNHLHNLLCSCKFCAENLNKQKSSHIDNSAVRSPSQYKYDPKALLNTQHPREARQEFNSCEYPQGSPSVTFPSEAKFCHMPTSVFCNWKQFYVFLLQATILIPLLAFSQDRIISQVHINQRSYVPCLGAFKSIKPSFWTISGNATFKSFQHNPVIITHDSGGSILYYTCIYSTFQHQVHIYYIL